MGPKKTKTAKFADLLLINGHLITLDPDYPEATALAIKNTKIVWIGSKEQAKDWEGPQTKVLDLEGAYAYPGFIDSHAHIIYTGLVEQSLKLWGITSKLELLNKVRDEASTLPAGKWIWGIGWDEHLWTDSSPPTLAELTEAAPQNPVVMQRCDTHLIAVNQAALTLANINASTPDTDEGVIYRDSHGNLTGLLSDNAMTPIFNAMPKPTAEENLKLTQWVMQDCLKKGITSIHNASTYEWDFEAFKTLALKDELPVRIYVMATVDGKYSNSIYENGPQKISPFLELRCLKLFIDGALGSRGAALLEPYHDNPGTSGNLIWKKKDLWKTLQHAKEMGFQVATHAIGDRAVRLILDAYEVTGCHGLRWRVEHAQIVAPEDVSRFGKLGVIAAVQPLHATADMPWMKDRLGDQRNESEAFPWRTMLDTGATIAGGSDAPVVEINPLWGIYAAITRQDKEGNPLGGWYPLHRMTPLEALKAYTINSAYAGFRDNELGSLTPGKLADIVVLPENILTCDPKKLLDMEVQHTIVNGKIQYSHPFM